MLQNLLCLSKKKTYVVFSFFSAQPEVFGKVDARHRLGLDFLRRAKKIGDSVKIRGL